MYIKPMKKNSIGYFFNLFSTNSVITIVLSTTFSAVFPTPDIIKLIYRCINKRWLVC